MPIDLNNNQLDRLKNLGIEIGGGNDFHKNMMVSSRRNNGWMLVVGTGLVGMAGLVLMVAVKNKSAAPTKTEMVLQDTDNQKVARVTPADSIQKYLLTSQQYLSQAVLKQEDGNNQETTELLNKSLKETDLAITNFPQDYRGYQQRGKIYQSLISSSDPLTDQDKTYTSQAIADFLAAYKLNSEVAEISRDLATLYARLGDAKTTVFYLSSAIRIEPTKAQNFYDLAKIQSQGGDIVGALETYKQLLWLVSDSNQKDMIEKEKQTLEEILAQNPDVKNNRLLTPTTPTAGLADGKKLQASIADGVVIAVGTEANDLEVAGMTDSNALSGVGKLTKGEVDIEIKNSNVGEKSLVYVTITNGGKNQTLRVKSKTESGFRVGLDVPCNEDIEFKWWIVN